MKRFLKSNLSLFLAITIIFSSAYVGLNEIDFSGINFKISFAVESKAANSGTCGDNLKWTLDGEGTLTISGTGDMYDYPIEYDEDDDPIYSSPWSKNYSNHIKTIVVDSGVTSIGSNAFYHCTKLTSIIIPDSVTSIGSSAFVYCTSLSSITFGNGITTIGRGVFSNCTSLTSVTIPDSVTSIGEDAFYGCTNLKAVYITDLAAWCSINFWGYDDIYVDEEYGSNKTSNPLSYAKELYLNGELLTDIVIPDGVENVNAGAFYEYTSFKSVTIPDSVTSIGSYAFKGCTSLSSITIPDSVISIGDNAFSSCTKLVTIILPDNEIGVGKSAFSGTAIESIVIPEGTESISDGAFYYCFNLTSLKLPSTIKTIGEQAFAYCGKLESIALPDGLTKIGKEAFRYCNKLESIEIPETVTSLGGYAFSDCDSLAIVKLPDGMKTISTGLFHNSGNLKEIVIPGTVTAIKKNAFWACYSLEKVVLPDTLTSIGQSAFEGCYNLLEINLPKSLTLIDSDAFNHCSQLKSITIPENIDSLDASVFSECYKLEAISVASKNKTFSSKNGVLFNKDKTTLIMYPIGNLSDTYKVPNGVKIIGANAFEECINLKKISIPDSVTNIGHAAFASCIKLTDIKLPENLKVLEKLTFENCKSLKNVTFNKGLKKIKTEAFYNCEKLESITIPKGVTQIYSKVFLDCKNLKNITLPDTISKIGGSAFYNTAYFNTKTNWKNKVLYIGNYLIKAKASLSGAYEIRKNTRVIADSAFENCKKITSVKMPDSLVTISNRAFYECSGLKALDVPDNVTYLGEDAFYRCYSLYSVKLNDRLERIEPGCFQDCGGINYIKFGKGLKSIGPAAFYGCDSLSNIFLYDGLVSIGGSAFYDCWDMSRIAIPSSVEMIGECALGYADVEDEGEVVDRYFKIYAAKGTAAEEYAKAVGLKFVEHSNHSFEKWTVTEKATVNAEGIKYKKCSVCMAKELAVISQLKCSNPTLKKVQNTTSGVKITWGKVKGADTYNIYRKTKSGSYSKIGSTKNAYYTDKKAKSGKRYYYIVKAVNEAGSSSASKSKSILHLADPTLKSISNSQYGVRISWNKVSGAEKYNVYRKTSSGSYSKIGTTSKAYYTDKKAKSGRKYYYIVKAVKGSVTSASSSAKSILHLADPTLKTPSSTKSGVKLTWTKVTGAEGYIIYRKTGSGSYTKIKTEKGVSNLSYTDSSAKKGKKYTYKVKAYKSKTYSAYSNTKTITDKY